MPVHFLLLDKSINVPRFRSNDFCLSIKHMITALNHPPIWLQQQTEQRLCFSRQKPSPLCLLSIGDGERREGARVAAVHEGSGQQGQRGRRVAADGLSLAVLGELPAHTALHPAHGRAPAAAVPPLHRHHGQWPFSSRWYKPRISPLYCKQTDSRFGGCSPAGIIEVLFKMKE